MKNYNASKNTIETCVTVHASECNGNAERMVRRFIKKVKREGIVEEIRDRSHFTKPAARRTEAKRNRQRVIQKVNNKRNELFNVKDRSRPKRRN